MSLRLAILNRFLRWFEKPKLARAKTPDDLRIPFERKARLLFRAPRASQFKDDVFQTADHSVPVHWANAPQANQDQVILYFHGGGYVFGSPRTHRAMLARLSLITGMTTCLPKYRLAPENPFPAAIEDAITAYRTLLDRGVAPDRIIIGGDSAGGGLALALLGVITDRKMPKPAGVFAFSPLTNLTFSGASFVENQQVEVMLPAERAADMAHMYLGDADPKDPRASPILARFSNQTPVFLTASDHEILLDDTREMAQIMRGYGVAVTEQIVQNHPHVWQIFQGFLPEADQGLRDVAAWIKPLLHR